MLAAISGGAGAYSGDALDPASLDVRIASVGDMDVAYRIMGSGEPGRAPLLMITGFKCAMDMWDPRLLNYLSARNRVVIFDNRGTGYTMSPPQNFSLEDLSNDTLGLMDALKIERANILGYSMGAFVAQEMAIRHPERVDRIILYAGDSWRPSPQVLDLLSNSSGPGTPVERAMKKIGLLVPAEWLSNDTALVDWFFVPKESLPDESVQRQLRAMESWPGTCDRLDLIGAPTLVISGNEDAIFQETAAFNLTRGIRGSWLVQFTGAGHGLMYQYPERMARAIDSFIELSG